VGSEPHLFGVLSNGIGNTLQRCGTHAIILAGLPIGLNCAVKHETSPDEAAVGDERGSAQPVQVPDVAETQGPEREAQSD
jgi:hypothetical protein